MDVHPSHIAVAIALKHALSSPPGGHAEMHVLLCLLKYMDETSAPAPTHESLIHDLEHVIPGSEVLPVAVDTALGQIRTDGAEVLMSLVNDLRRLVVEKPAPNETAPVDTHALVERRSPAGLFLRRLTVAFHRLPYPGVLALVRDIQHWTGGLAMEGTAEEIGVPQDEWDRRRRVGMDREVRWKKEALDEDDGLPVRLDAFEGCVAPLCPESN
jgi:hypothetical protein